MWVKENPLKFSAIFPMRLGMFFVQILHAYYAFLSKLEYKFLFAYLQLWRSYAILSTTLHPVHIMCAKCPPSAESWNARWHFLTVFPNSWEFLVQILYIYYTFLSPLDYKFLFNYLQLWRSYAILSATTKRAFRPMVDILSIWWWSRLIWHNFVKVADNWIKNLFSSVDRNM